MASRDELRKVTVGVAPRFRSKIIDYEGLKFELRQPSVRLKSRLMQKARVPMVENKNELAEKIDFAALQAWTLIYCTYVPGTDEHVFNEADFDVIVDSPAGGYVDALGEAAMEMIGAQPEIDAKNSESPEEQNDS